MLCHVHNLLYVAHTPLDDPSKQKRRRPSVLLSPPSWTRGWLTCYVESNHNCIRVYEGQRLVSWLKSMQCLLSPFEKALLTLKWLFRKAMGSLDARQRLCAGQNTLKGTANYVLADEDFPHKLSRDKKQKRAIQQRNADARFMPPTNSTTLAVPTLVPHARTGSYNALLAAHS